MNNIPSCCGKCENFYINAKYLSRNCRLNEDGVFPQRFNCQKSVVRWCPLKENGKDKSNNGYS